MPASERNLVAELPAYADQWDQLAPRQKHDILMDVSEYVLRCASITVSKIPRRLSGRGGIQIIRPRNGSHRHRRNDSPTQSPTREVVHRKFDGFLSKALAVHKFYADQKSSGSYLIPVEFLRMENKAARVAKDKGLPATGLELMETVEDIFAEHYHEITGHKKAIAEEHIHTHITYAYVATGKLDFDSAHEHSEKAVYWYYEGMKASRYEIDIPEWTVWGSMANALSGLGDNASAQKYYEKAIRLKPRRTLCWDHEMSLGRCLIEQGKLGPAKEQLKSAIAEIGYESEFELDDERKLQLGLAHYWLGNAYIVMNGSYCTNESERSFVYHLEALQIFKQISRPDCDMLATTNYKVGWHFAHRGDFTTALYHFNAALEIFRYRNDRDYRKADIARILYYLGLTLYYTGEFKEADVAFEEALELRQTMTKNHGHYFDGMQEKEVYDRLVSPWFR